MTMDDRKRDVSFPASSGKDANCVLAIFPVNQILVSFQTGVLFGMLFVFCLE